MEGLFHGSKKLFWIFLVSRLQYHRTEGGAPLYRRVSLRLGSVRWAVSSQVVQTNSTWIKKKSLLQTNPVLTWVRPKV